MGGQGVLMFVGSASLLLSSSTSASTSPSLTSFPHLNIVCWEEAEASMGFPDPPAFVDHLDIGYDVIGVEADLVVSLGLVVVEGDGSDATSTTSRGSLVGILIGVVLNVPSPCSWLFVGVLVCVFLDVTSSPRMSFSLGVFIQLVLLITRSRTLILIEFVLLGWKVIKG